MNVFFYDGQDASVRSWKDVIVLSYSAGYVVFVDPQGTRWIVSGHFIIEDSNYGERECAES